MGMGAYVHQAVNDARKAIEDLRERAPEDAPMLGAMALELGFLERDAMRFSRGDLGVTVSSVVYPARQLQRIANLDIPRDE